jgi:hypothetical protein
VGVMVFGSPVVNLDWLSLLIAALAPLAWPMTTGAPASVEGDQPAASSVSRTVRAPSS